MWLKPKRESTFARSLLSSWAAWVWQAPWFTSSRLDQPPNGSWTCPRMAGKKRAWKITPRNLLRPSHKMNSNFMISWETWCSFAFCPLVFWSLLENLGWDQSRKKRQKEPKKSLRNLSYSWFHLLSCSLVLNSKLEDSRIFWSRTHQKALTLDVKTRNALASMVEVFNLDYHQWTTAHSHQWITDHSQCHQWKKMDLNLTLTLFSMPMLMVRNSTLILKIQTLEKSMVSWTKWWTMVLKSSLRRKSFASTATSPSRSILEASSSEKEDLQNAMNLRNSRRKKFLLQKLLIKQL